MELYHALLLFISCFFAGILNAVAGGGTFFAFPALLFTGAPAVAANATCTIALWPGAVASAFAYRKELGTQDKTLLYMVLLALVGGWFGAELLLRTDNATFEVMIPWLLLIATLLFTFGKHISRATQHNDDVKAQNVVTSKKRLIASIIFQIITALYGGFFGAGIGILTLAMLQLLRVQGGMHRMNAMKTIIASAINASAFATFILSDIVLWDKAVVMVAGGIAGGFFGAYYAMKLPQQHVRRFVIISASAMTCYFFVKYYG